MEPFPAGRLAKADQAKASQSFSHFSRGLDDPLERHIRSRIEIEDKSAWLIGMSRLAVPRVELKAGDLRDCDQALHAVDLKIGFRSPETVVKFNSFDMPVMAWR